MWFFVILFIILVLSIPFWSSKRKESSFLEEKLPFLKRKYFFSEAEKKFYLVLKQIADKNNWAIFPKVRLRDIFNPDAKYRSKESFSLNAKIVQKHVDFLLCDNNYFSPVAAIELDDSSHRLGKRQERDEFVDKVFASVKLPLVRIKVSFNYDINSIESRIKEEVEKNKN